MWGAVGEDGVELGTVGDEFRSLSGMSSSGGVEVEATELPSSMGWDAEEELDDSSSLTSESRHMSSSESLSMLLIFS